MMDLPEFGHLFTTGQEYVEYIHRLPLEQRKWHHTAYLWYHRNAKVILLGLAICAMIYTALVYRGLVSVAARGSIKSRTGKRKVVMTGGVSVFDENFGNNKTEYAYKGGQLVEKAKKPAPKPAPQPSYTGPSFADSFKATEPTASTGGTSTTQSTGKSSTGGSSTTNQTPTPSQQDEEKRDAKLQKKREEAAVKKAKQGDRPNYMSEGAHKRLTAAKDKVNAGWEKAKGAPKAFYKDLKSGKVTAQAKLMTQAAGAKIHDTVAQNASSVYTIIFSLFLFSGVALYFIPTIGMIGIGILTFYMFSDFVRGVITL